MRPDDPTQITYSYEGKCYSPRYGNVELTNIYVSGTPDELQDVIERISRVDGFVDCVDKRSYDVDDGDVIDNRLFVTIIFKDASLERAIDYLDNIGATYV